MTNENVEEEHIMKQELHIFKVCIMETSPNSNLLNLFSKQFSMRGGFHPPTFLEEIHLSTTVEPGVSKLFWKRKKVYNPYVVYYLAGDLC